MAEDPRILKQLDSLIAEMKRLDKKLPDQALAAWLLPVFVHIKPLVEGATIPKRVAELSALVGIELGGRRASTVKTEED